MFISHSNRVWEPPGQSSGSATGPFPPAPSGHILPRQREADRFSRPCLSELWSLVLDITQRSVSPHLSPRRVFLPSVGTDVSIQTIALNNESQALGKAQRLRAPTALPQDLTSIPSTHTAAHNSHTPSSGVQIYIQTKVPVYIKCIHKSSVYVLPKRAHINL